MSFQKRSGSAPIYRTKAHRAARKALIDAWQEGDPCCLCNHPLLPPDGQTRYLHADHDPTDDTGQTYRGLAHGYPCQVCGTRCNTSDGAKRGRAKQQALTEADQRWIL